MVGLSFGLKSRAYLFPDYFVFLTTWTDDEQTRSNLEFNWFIRTFTLEFLFEYLGDLTYGIISIFEGIGKSVSKSNFESIKGITSKELINPWSLIIPLHRVTHLELLTYGLKNKFGCIHLQTDLPNEGEKDLYVFLGHPKKGRKWANNINERIALTKSKKNSETQNMNIQKLEDKNEALINENLLDETRYLGSVRLLRTTTSWGIHAAIVLLGIIALPIVFVVFLAGGLVLMPIAILVQSFRFIWMFFGFHMKFPKLWETLFRKKKSISIEKDKISSETKEN